MKLDVWWFIDLTFFFFGDFTCMKGLAVTNLRTTKIKMSLEVVCYFYPLWIHVFIEELIHKIEKFTGQ